MRIVTWNCNGAFRDKCEQVAALKDHYKDDILVIQEAENPDQLPAVVRERYPNVVYVHGTRNKGLLVLASERHRIELAPEYDESYRFVVPIRVSGDVDCTLIAVWGQKTTDLWYTDYVLEALKLYESLIDERTIIAGDFNSTPTVKKPRKSDTDHDDLVTWLRDHGLVSAYHQATGEKHGHESRSTFALYRDMTRRFHVDYVFASHATLHPNAILSAITEAHMKYSDHVPLFVSLEIPSGRSPNRDLGATGPQNTGGMLCRTQTDETTGQSRCYTSNLKSGTYPAS